MQGMGFKNLIFRVSAAAAATLWRKTEPTPAARGVLFNKSTNKATDLIKEREPDNPTARLFSLYATPPPLVPRVRKKND